MQHDEWMRNKAGASSLEKLGSETLNRYQSDNYREALTETIKKSAKTALTLDNIRLIEKLILYQAYMMILVNNFVSFPYLYDPHKRAVFEMGTLIIDGRHFNFSLKIEDRGKHSGWQKPAISLSFTLRSCPDMKTQSTKFFSPLQQAEKETYAWASVVYLSISTGTR